MTDKSNLIFLDLETTGLDPNNDVILEIAALPVDRDLNILDDGWSEVIRPTLPNNAGKTFETVDSMDASYILNRLKPRMHEVVLDMHDKNGLFAEIEAGWGLSLQSAVVAFLQYAEQYVPRGETPLAGSSVHFDRRFLQNYMPSIDKFFHYRIADVSSLKEFWRRWWPEGGEPPKVKAHRALADCYESVNEAKWYRNRLSLDPKEPVGQVRGH